MALTPELTSLLETRYLTLALLSIFVAVVALALATTRKQRRPDGTVSHLAIFPIKACRAIYVDSATVTARGFENDRTFMLVSPGKEGKWDNHHISLNPIDALIQPRISGQQLIVSSPNNEQDLTVPLRPSATEPHSIEMHHSGVMGVDMGMEAEEWFTKACGQQTKLIYLPEERSRKVLGNASLGTDGGRGITFADCAGYLVLNGSSLREFSRLLGRPMSMDPLRPSIVVEPAEGKLEAWSEDYWRRMKIGTNGNFDVTANCPRCNSLDIDYNTGKREYVKGVMSPLKAIMGTRRIDNGMKYSPVFGRYAYSPSIGTVIRVGDPIWITQKIKQTSHLEWPGISY